MKYSIKTSFHLLFVLIALGSLLTFGSKSTLAKDTFIIGFSQATTTEPWRLLFNQEARSEAAKHPNVTLLVRNGQDSVPKQVADMEEFIARKVDAILISPKEADGLTAVVNKAFNAGIPVFVLDRDISNDHYTQFIGGDNILIGRTAGAYAVELLGGRGKAKGTIVEIWGGMKSTPAHDRHNGFWEVVSKEAGIKLLNKAEDGDWKQDKAYEIAANAMEAHDRIDVIYAHNDPMAYGAYLAASDIKREKDIAFIGIDAIPGEGVMWVHEGKLDATFLYKTPGADAIRQALMFLQGKEIDKRLTLPTQRITSKNAKDILLKHKLIKP
ncbi:Periplasmic binding protein/LacI transcriptional regulator [Candidatus Terasakiella magnetica]|uniref:Periplasmic binding protein/LacI transcriptional regulator n=1 Tax=Candidatus Terasakiella magnetica TaxID=1867952 RepID=A0A1C3RDJ7_9PROT|nr:substrate-binding domain-containing protein [Candidatus Terasakiella magnetica]SCA55339.1 Periplasmic binding protein/LacI transcriptional regulator [Candidatus Terasakiella magnetica]